MALIGKIRNNFWFVLVLLGFALAAFILMDITSSSGQITAADGPTLGTVGGQKIAYNEFRRAEASLYRNSGADSYAVQNTLWNFFVEKAVIDKEADANGIGVSKEELLDLQFGNKLSPIIQQNFRNPQTGQVDRAQLNEIKTAIEEDNFTNPDFRAYWAEQEKQILKTRKQNKLNSIVSKGMFTPTWMIENEAKENGTSASFQYVKVPFDKIADDKVTISDTDLTNHINNNKVLYTNDVSQRKANYFEFDVTPTNADTILWKSKIEQLIVEFKVTDSDSLFAMNHNGNYNTYYANASELPQSLKNIVPSMNSGDIYGPYIEDGFFNAVKLVDQKVVPDSVSAKHILRSVEAGNKAQLAAANAYIDSLQQLLVSGRAKFDTLAQKNSQDPGSALNGGDLGTFGQGRMVPEFNEVCFFGQPRKYYKVTSQFGVHLIYVNKQIFNNRDNKYKIATVAQAIIPSKNTQDSLYVMVTDLVSENRDYESFMKASESLGVLAQLTPSVDKNAYTLGSLPSGDVSRDIVKWMFENSTEVGEVSPNVFIYSDPDLYYNNKYVVASLDSESPKGLQQLDDVRSDVSLLVRNQKKGSQISSEIGSGNLAAVAAQYGLETQIADNVTLNTPNIPGLGNEPKILAELSNLEVGANAGPIIGKNGVYMISITAKEPAPPATNIPSLRQSNHSTTRAGVNFGLISALKKAVEIEDNRIDLDM